MIIMSLRDGGRPSKQSPVREGCFVAKEQERLLARTCGRGSMCGIGDNLVLRYMLGIVE